MSMKELLLAIVDQDATRIMETFEAAVEDKIALLIESRKDFVAAHLISENGPEDLDDDWEDDVDVDEEVDDDSEDESEEIPGSKPDAGE